MSVDALQTESACLPFSHSSCLFIQPPWETFSKIAFGVASRSIGSGRTCESLRIAAEQRFHFLDDLGHAERFPLDLVQADRVDQVFGADDRCATGRGSAPE